jgi:hypothetical protein
LWALILTLLLTIRFISDHSYEYAEKLYSGAYGWTNGKWDLKKRKIQFTCDRKPLVRYSRTIHPDSSVRNFQLLFLLANTETPIYIESVKIFNAKQVLSDGNFQMQKNVVRIFLKEFDSIVINPINFRPISFSNHLSTNMGYKIRMHPAERLYMLDKVPFQVGKNKLINIPTKQYGKRSIAFEKPDY